MGLWNDRLLPRVIDVACGNAQITPYRVEALAGLSGRVLDVGFGSGTNLPHLPAEVSEVVAVEPSETAWQLSAKRRAASGADVQRSGLDGQSLMEPDASVDHAVITFALCTIPDPVAALREVRRVLRPGGQLRFLEHGLAPDAGVERWQRRLDGVQQKVFGGCHLSRDIPEIVRASGFTVDEVRGEYVPGPKPWSYGYIGRAS
jgi:SAM-dependent methyltransferase